MGKQYGYFEWDDSVGEPGRRSDGSLHQNLYNEDRELAGHARFVPVDEPLDVHIDAGFENTFVTSDSRRHSEESDELAEAIGQALAALALVGMAKAAPHVKKWWDEQARTAVSRQAKKIRSIGRKKKPETGAVEPTELQPEVEIAHQQVMSREEAMSRLIAALAARAFSDDQLRILKSSRIVDVDDFAQIEQAVAQIPAAQLQALIVEMVKNPGLLEDSSLANLASMLHSRAELPELIPDPTRRADTTA